MDIPDMTSLNFLGVPDVFFSSIFCAWTRMGCPTLQFFQPRFIDGNASVTPPLPFRVEAVYTAQQKKAFEFGFADGQGPADSCITLGGQPCL